MTTQTITLTLPESVVQRAKKMAQTLERPLEEVLTLTLSNTLPDVDDAPPEIQADLMQMTWLDDQSLWDIAHSEMLATEQTQLVQLSQQQTLTQTEQKTVQELRQQYGELTLRKARAFALLSIRAGKPLLASNS